MPRNKSVWIIDDDQSIRWVLQKALGQAGIKTLSFDNAKSVVERLRDEQPGALLSDIRMPGMDGLDLLAHIQATCPQVPVIIMTAHSDLDSAVQSHQGGAFEYLPKPFDMDEAVALVRRALAHVTKPAPGQSDPPISQSDGLIGEAPAMQEVFRTIGRLSQSHITVLINGASGTGKELVARALHHHSPRREAPFVALNMAAIARELIESELFGHERGAFTGATALRQGRFEQADGGTLFLDEIGDMPLETQTRLLRVLSEGSFHRVGGRTSIHADVRIIAATHQDLETRVRQGRFREDLFYRLNVVRIQLPRLSERREDIIRLATFFMQKAARDLRIEPHVLLPETEQHLTRLEWPGNVRQLENACRWISVMAAGREVHIRDLPPDLQLSPPREAAPGAESGAVPEWQALLAQWARLALGKGRHDLLRQALPAFERILIEAALSHAGGGRQEAARLLGWGRNTLTRKIKEHGLRAADPEAAEGSE